MSDTSMGGKGRASRDGLERLIEANFDVSARGASNLAADLLCRGYSAPPETPLRRPRCSKPSCNRPVSVYVAKTGDDLCEQHGENWSEDEKIPIRYERDSSE